ncbi:MAG TPA: hypothetical protein VFZ00_01420 [Solirubrobacter sp.]|nr:hypothetical protein [Solirubrobacter sp.]
MDTVMVTLLDGEYSSTDQGNDHAPIHLTAGESVDVSKEKAEQLAADFPDLFEVDGESAEPEPIDGYTAMNQAAILAKLAELDDETVAKIKAFEAAHKKRAKIVDWAKPQV